MPELPEVETIVRELCPRLLGLRIARIRVGKIFLFGVSALTDASEARPPRAQAVGEQSEEA